MSPGVNRATSFAAALIAQRVLGQPLPGMYANIHTQTDTSIHTQTHTDAYKTYI